MATIVTSAECLAALTSLTSAQIAELPTVISHSTSLLESYCETFLVSRPWVDIAEPGQSRTLRLSSGNVTAVDSVRAGSRELLTVSAVGFDRATVKLNLSGDPPFTSATGVTLWSRANGVDTTTTLDFATYPTVGALGAAIGSVPGWSAVPASGYESFATADLDPVAGARGALSRGVWLNAFVYDVDDYDVDADAGIIRLGARWVSDVFRYPDRSWGSLPRYSQARVSFAAGFINPPADLKRAAILTIKAIFDSEPFPGLFSMERSAGVYTYSFAGNPDVVPPTAKAILARGYRRIGL